MISTGQHRAAHNAENIRGYRGLDHIAVAVSHFEEARHIYGTVLGANLSETHELKTRGLMACFATLGETTLELLAPLHQDSEISSFLRRRGPGIHHICVRVSDLPAALAGMEAEGARLVLNAQGRAMQTGARGEKVAFVHPKSTQGVLLELLECRDFSHAVS